MKKYGSILLLFLLVSTLLFSLTGCSGTDTGADKKSGEEIAVEKIAKYVMDNGDPLNDTAYHVSKKSGDSAAGFIWDGEKRVLKLSYTTKYYSDETGYQDLVCMITYKTDSDSLTINEYAYGEIDYSEEGTFSKSSFSSEKYKSAVTLQSSNSPYGGDPEVRLGMLIVLVLSDCENALEDMNIGVTLKDLGFTSWE